MTFVNGKKFWIYALALFVLALVAHTPRVEAQTCTIPAVFQADTVGGYELTCDDGIDNDGDGLIDAADPDCMCMNLAYQTLLNVKQTPSCTANDAGLVVLGLGHEFDGCVNPTDTLKMQFRAELAPTTGKTRYNFGIWINTNGGTSALSGTLCARQALIPIQGGSCLVNALGTPNFCGQPGEPACTSEYAYFDHDGTNVCGDVAKTDPQATSPFNGAATSAVYDFAEPIDLPCGNPGQVVGGFLHVATAASWYNNATTCSSMDSILPEQGSKCGASDLPGGTATDVPVPNLALSCNGGGNCTTTVVGGVPQTTCSVTYTNNQVCTPNASTLEQYQCGTAAYIQFLTSYDATKGSIISASATDCNGNTQSLGNGITDNSSTGTLTWTPVSDNGTPGIISPNSSTAACPNGETGTLTYTYQWDPTKYTTGSTTNITTNTYWYPDNTFTGGVLQTDSNVHCNGTFTTPVTLASFEAKHGSGSVDFNWSTGSEAGNVGFNLYAKTAKGMVKLNSSVIPARGTGAIGVQSYSFSVNDRGLANSEFYIADVAVDGTQRTHGPFRLASYGHRIKVERLDWQAVHAAHQAAVAERKQAARMSHGSNGLRGLAAAAHSQPAQQAVDIEVNDTGLYRVTYEDLKAAGYDLAGAKVNELGLFNQGHSVQLEVDGSSSFGPGDSIEFYGQAIDTLYSGTNVYTLMTGVRHPAQAGVDHGRIGHHDELATYYMATSKLEGHAAYDFTSNGSTPWYERALFSAGSSTSWTTTLSADGYVPESGAAVTLSLNVWGDSVAGQNPHHVQAQLNGVNVADSEFNGRSAKTITANVPPTALQAGSNSLTLVLPGDTGAIPDVVDFAGYTLSYPHAFVAADGRLLFKSPGSAFTVTGLSSSDVVVYRADNANSLTRIANVTVSGSGSSYSATFPGSGHQATYLVSTAGALLSPAGYADYHSGASITQGPAEYLIISHPDFIDGLAPLIQAHESEGMTVKVVDVDDVYGHYSGGVFSAQAIRDYIAYAVQHMGTKYVLLVGGDTYDYRNFLGYGAFSFMPTLYEPTSDLIRWAPADPAYVDVNSDGVPDAALGRLPVRTASQLQNVVQKTLEYMSKGYARTAVFASDAKDTAAGVSFKDVSDALTSDLPLGWTKTEANIEGSTVSQARSTLIGAINNGVAYTDYVGHSDPYSWSFDGLLTTGDVAGFTNSGLPTVVAQWGCWNTYYSTSSNSTLGLKLILAPDTGAAAVLGASTRTDFDSDRALAYQLTPLITQPGMTIGEAVLQAKQKIATGPGGGGVPDVMYGWTELGDPALKVEP